MTLESQIYQDYVNGLSIGQLAEKHSVSYSYVKSVIERRMKLP